MLVGLVEVLDGRVGLASHKCCFASGAGAEEQAKVVTGLLELRQCGVDEPFERLCRALWFAMDVCQPMLDAQTQRAEPIPSVICPCGRCRGGSQPCVDVPGVEQRACQVDL